MLTSEITSDRNQEPLLFEAGVPGLDPERLPARLDVPEAALPADLLRDDLPLPEVSEVQVVRHFTRLSQLNFSVDTHFYPLGSCTMKYNPKVNDWAAGLSGFTHIHPYQPEETVQGALEMMYELQYILGEVAGLPAVTLQPSAGAHGELTGILVIMAYHRARGDTARKRVLVPDSAHGTNPATAAMVGCSVTPIPTDARGNLDLEILRREMDETVAAIMLTNPNTLGLFEEHILDVTELVHERGGMVYCDGANMNAVLGIARPGDLGCDVLHYNLHKTFTVPHGGGGPGAGGTAVCEALAPFLPVPVVAKREGANGPEYYLDFDQPQTIGRVRAFYGNFGNAIRGYAYLKSIGAEGLRDVSEYAVLNANYIRARLIGTYDLPYDRICKHEAVFSGRRQARLGVKTLDIAKRLIDFGIHPPTVYFPLIVEEALMIEPTETETKATLDHFIAVMERIAREAEETPELVKEAPHTTPIGRPDDVAAARKPVVRWQG
jgi:glycine dehydrogenase subunit 2